MRRSLRHHAPHRQALLGNRARRRHSQDPRTRPPHGNPHRRRRHAMRLHRHGGQGRRPPVRSRHAQTLQGQDRPRKERPVLRGHRGAIPPRIRNPRLLHRRGRADGPRPERHGGRCKNRRCQTGWRRFVIVGGRWPVWFGLERCGCRFLEHFFNAATAAAAAPAALGKQVCAGGYRASHRVGRVETAGHQRVGGLQWRRGTSRCNTLSDDVMGSMDGYHMGKYLKRMTGRMDGCLDWGKP
ncbi:uncharacterized protein IWZ02DRAFT_317928 [Phyllosticta citriasiana]|uniref:Uncharacterized protein n=1 Tax=Phyllosticta citriasiana TaxID=595635 RepID=A0ABR1KXU0_9PEZI